MSELRDALRDVRRALPWIVVGTLVIMTVTVAVAAYRPTSYTTSIAFSVNRVNVEKTPYYEYDGYYAIQASDLFSQTIVSWFLTPSVLLDVYADAGVDPNIDSLDRFTSRFKTRKYSAQNIVVKYMERDEATARALATAIIDTVERRAGELNQSADRKALFEVHGSTPVVVQNRVQWPLTIAVGLLVGMLASITVATIVFTLRRA